MTTYSLTEVSDQALLRNLASLVTQERSITAHVLAYIAEVDARKLYLPAAYPSMHAWCMGELRFSENATFKRIYAARAARRFPEIFLAVADGRLHVSAVIMIAPHLESGSASELIAAASMKTRAQIEELLAARNPRPDVPEQLRALPMQLPVSAQGSLEDFSQPCVNSQAPDANSSAHKPDNCCIQQHAPGHVCHIIERAKVTPLAPGRYALQVTLSQATREKLRHAQELLGHGLPSGAIAEVLDRALDALIERLEKRKFARTAQPRARTVSDLGGTVLGPGVRGVGVHEEGVSGASPRTTRHIPAEVKRTVWQRDQGRCTFVSAEGRRCAGRTRLEFDHMDEFARGGVATTERMRLRCRAHNQYGAECTFGAGFMQEKRAQARWAQMRTRARLEQEQEITRRAAREEAESSAVVEVIPWLRHLGIRMDEARRAAARCAEIPGATLEERVRLALSSLRR